MAFEKGQEKIGGREKGVPNKRTLAIREYAASRGASPAQFLIDVLVGDGESVGKEIITFDDKKWAVELLMPYLEAKRKPVDSKGDDSESLVSLFLGQLNDRG